MSNRNKNTRIPGSRSATTFPDALLKADRFLEYAIDDAVHPMDVIPILGELSTAMLTEGHRGNEEIGNACHSVHHLERDIRLVVQAKGDIKRVLKEAKRFLQKWVAPVREELEAIA